MTQLKLQLVLLIALTPIDAGRRVEVGGPLAMPEAKANALQAMTAARPANEEEVKEFVAFAIAMGASGLPVDLVSYVQAELEDARSTDDARSAAEAQAADRAAADAQRVADAKAAADAQASADARAAAEAVNAQAAAAAKAAADAQAAADAEAASAKPPQGKTASKKG